MRRRRKSPRSHHGVANPQLVQIGVLLLCAGVLVKFANVIVHYVRPFAETAIVAGVVLAVVGVFVSRR